MSELDSEGCANPPLNHVVISHLSVRGISRVSQMNWMHLRSLGFTVLHCCGFDGLSFIVSFPVYCRPLRRPLAHSCNVRFVFHIVHPSQSCQIPKARLEVAIIISISREIGSYRNPPPGIDRCGDHTYNQSLGRHQRHPQNR